MDLFAVLWLTTIFSVAKARCGKKFCGNYNGGSNNNEYFLTPSTFSWHAHIEADKVFCGGVLISPTHVLTAAHCVTTTDNRNILRTVGVGTISVVLGLHDRVSKDPTGLQAVRVRSINFHSDYDDDTGHADIAVLTLVEDVKIDERVSLVCLTHTEVSDNTICYVTGFGVRDDKGTESEKMRIIRTPYVERNKCDRLIKKFFPSRNFTETMCCAGGGENGSLDVYNQWRLQGLVSWGTIVDCGKIKNIPGIYTNVPNLYEWVRQITGIDTVQSDHWENKLCQKYENSIGSTTTAPTTESATIETSENDTTDNHYCYPHYMGLQEVKLPNGTKILINCDINKYGDGWLVIERRISGRVDFKMRSGNEFIVGFGDVRSDDYWIGLDVMHQLTVKKPMELCMDIWWCDWPNSSFIYEHFKVGSAEFGYQLNLKPSEHDFPNEGMSAFNNQPFTYSDPISGKHEYTGWWWNERPTISLHQQLGCDIPQPANNFWYLRDNQRRRPIKSFELKIRPMESTKDKMTFGSSLHSNLFVKRPVPVRSPTELKSFFTPMRHCQDIFDHRRVRENGPQEILLDNGQKTVVLCDMTTDAGGWTVIQRRVDGNESFERNWTEYANGFGNVSADHWAGNILISQLTTTEEQMELRLEYSVCGYANKTSHVYKYTDFVVGDEYTNFVLLTLTEPNYTATAYARNQWEIDGFAYNRGWQFSAPQIPASRRNCVQYLAGGWWYNACGTLLNFNGKFGCKEIFPNGNFEILNAMPNMRMIKSTSMMIRPYKPSAPTSQPAPWPRPAFTTHPLTRDCQDFFEKRPNRTEKRIAVAIDVLHELEPGLVVWCEFDSDSGKIWTFIMRRIDGSETFERSWIDYKFGFGDRAKGKDHWIGNQYLWAMTNSKFWELKIDVTFCDGTHFSQTYPNFKVAEEAKRFRLTFDGRNDDFSSLSGNEFSTVPFQYAIEPNCATLTGGGGWWWSNVTSNCAQVNFSGKLGCFESFPSCTYWRSSQNSTIRIIKTVEMKMRRF